MEYMENRPCPKCGNHYVRTRYDGTIDVLVRICEKCGYSWSELPNDRESQTAGKPPGGAPVAAPGDGQEDEREEGGMKIEVEVSEELFHFVVFEDWCDNARRRFEFEAMRSSDALCVDAKGRICAKGKEFMRARDDGAFPVRVYRAVRP